MTFSGKLHRDKVKVHTSKSTNAFLEKLKVHTSIEFIPFQHIPAKSHKDSSMDYCASDLRKRALSSYNPTTTMVRLHPIDRNRLNF